MSPHTSVQQLILFIFINKLDHIFFVDNYCADGLRRMNSFARKAKTTNCSLLVHRLCTIMPWDLSTGNSAR